MPEFTFDGKSVPFQPGDTVGSALHRAGVKVISRSLRYHRPRGLFGKEGEFVAELAVFQREGEPCPRCGKAIKRIVQSGRSTFFCQRCQR